MMARVLFTLATAALCSAPTCGGSAPAVDCAGDPGTCRTTCGYGSGDLATLTLSDFTALGDQIPIDTIVLVMQENRTFDSYFSSLTVPGQTVDGAAPDATNPDPTMPGATVSRFHQTAACFDNPAESWDEVHREVDGGALDGFTTQNALSDAADPQGLRSMGYYDETDLPYYYALARAWAISDRHFASVLANTFTNRLFYMAGTAYGITSNVVPPQTAPDGSVLPNLFTRLDDANITWAFYAQDAASLALLTQTWAKNLAHVLPLDQFATDAAAGALPQVVFVEGSDMLGGASPDEDPPADFQAGQAFVSTVVSEVTSSPQWPHLAMFFSYDEQGGLYDHVPPPAACIPDDLPPMIDSGGVDAAYDSYGLRVPLFVISPYAKRGYVSHEVTDHTSILRFIEARFGLPALTHRDANAVPPFDMFDFANPDTSVPSLPTPTVDQTQLAACASKYPKS